MAKKIYCLAEMGMQFDMVLNLHGGGEKYLNDFITLLKILGYEVHLYQFSYEKITTKFYKHKIHGIGNVKPNTKNYEQDTIEGLQYFAEKAKDADGIFLLSMNLSRLKTQIPTLTVSHGLFFDGYDNLPNHGHNMMERMKSWVRNSTQFISVDTNSIHAMQLLYPKFSKKMKFIPNYVDLDVFKYKEKDYSGRFKVLFARRVDPARGYVLAARAAKILTEKYNDIDFIFCGRGHKHEEDKLHSIIDGYPNIIHTSCEPDEMYKIYEEPHVSWVPTLKSEGTSLSAIESMAMGCVPIVSTIGGLPDVVSNLNNGLIISPDNIDELVEATEYLYHNRDELIRMRDLGLQMAKGFSKERWLKQITEVVKSLYGEP